MQITNNTSNPKVFSQNGGGDNFSNNSRDAMSGNGYSGSKGYISKSPPESPMLKGEVPTVISINDDEIDMQ
jgi:hypothetical protein